MSGYPWVRFFPSDWLAGTRGLTCAETGIYISLVAMMYERGGRIKDEPARLARMCGASNSAFKKALETLIAERKITSEGGYLSNKRVVEELSYSSEKSEVARAAAKSRWAQKPNENKGGGYADAMPAQCDGNANQKPEPEPEERSDAIASDAREVTPPADAEFAEWYAAYPNKVGRAAALKAFKAARHKASVPALHDGLARYIREKPPDREWCHPATWLNQERWLDEPAAVAKGQGHGTGRGGRVGPATAAINAILGTRYGQAVEPEFLDAEYRVVRR